MEHFTLIDGALHCERVPLERIAAEVGTPVYVYSRAMFEHQADIFRAGLVDAGIENAHLAYAIKANPNRAVLAVLARRGYGADVVSGGEMQRALAAGMPAHDIVFSGVGKTRGELASALDVGIGQFNLELEEEGEVLAAIAAAGGTSADAVLRVNPDVDAGTHAKISTGKAENKFGVAIDQAVAMYGRLAALPGLNMRGVAIHIGSQLLDITPLEAAYTRIGQLVAELRAAGHTIERVDLGGGLGVPYKAGDVPPSTAAYGTMVARVTRGWNVQLMFEPGRFIAGNAGVLLTRVIWVKPGAVNPYVIVDAAMNDLARPALYDAWHDFVAVRPNGERMMANIAGPVCESGDTFAMGRDVDAVKSDDLAVFRTAGAYGATMASTYNSRALVPEVLVDGDRYAVVADRIDPATILAAERLPDWLTA
ncbi:MAG: diaminopimelate decarboxylase [Sphingomonas bacterium]|uniref:diaminopimelate decarboxylase n=1 Tax=Sphingomonas bacterium TaxID=1895847 RepID=UPI0026137E87|nr:diaminopimelate decarboxylase [Sphingomonas bacterium]MDB5712315.1 diaminopimelate decarboxylase [Sphingomonas bacterium]